MELSLVKQSIEPRPDTNDVLVTHEPIIKEVRAMPTSFDLLAAAEPIVGQPKEGPPESCTTVSSAFEKEDNQLVLPDETVEPVAPLMKAAAD